MPAPEADLSLLREAALAAGKLAMSHFGGNVAVWNKSPGHPVTEADMAVDALLAERLRRARPDYGWLSEETSEAFSARDRHNVFVVDPIDGTRAFIRGEKYWCIGLAVLAAGRAVAGVVYNPVTQELFEAHEGGGAFLNGNPIRASEHDEVRGCRMIAAEQLVTGSQWRSPWPDMEFADPKPNATLYRMALVASGVWDAAVVLWRKSDWDLAPAEIIVREAGGLATTHDGEDFRFNQSRAVQKSLLAAGPRVHALLKERFRVVQLPDPHADQPVSAAQTPPKVQPNQTARSKMTKTETKSSQLLHIVFGGELKDVAGVEFEDLKAVDFVGAFASYKEAYDAWKAAAHRTVDHAETRYFILHAHRLLDPETGDHHSV